MSPITSLLDTDRQPIPPKLFPNVLAGLTVGLVSLTYSVSFAALILLILTIIAIWGFLVERLMYAHTDIEELL